MKKRNKYYDGKTRLIYYYPTANDGGNYYLCKWDSQKKLWKGEGVGKDIRKLLPLMDGNRYRFFISKGTREKLLKISESKSLSSLVKKLPIIENKTILKIENLR
jgi:hypothetical protein